MPRIVNPAPVQWTVKSHVTPNHQTNHQSYKILTPHGPPLKAEPRAVHCNITAKIRYGKCVCSQIGKNASTARKSPSSSLRRSLAVRFVVPVIVGRFQRFLRVIRDCVFGPTGEIGLNWRLPSHQYSIVTRNERANTTA